jgi:prevent-host-death family protein
MMTVQVSIGQVKRDISELVNRVAFGGERIVLTSRGKPKAVLISVEDYSRLQAIEEEGRIVYREKWIANTQSLANQIRESHDNQLIDLDSIIEKDQDERDQRYE